MVVFIGNLPKQAVEKDLCQLAHLPVGTPLRIVRKESRTGEMRRFALVPVTHESQVQRLINRLHGREWQGHTLIAREYEHRTANNERRRVDWRRQAWIGAERRLDERRNRAAKDASRVA